MRKSFFELCAQGVTPPTLFARHHTVGGSAHFSGGQQNSLTPPPFSLAISHTSRGGQPQGVGGVICLHSFDFADFDPKMKVGCVCGGGSEV